MVVSPIKVVDVGSSKHNLHVYGWMPQIHKSPELVVLYYFSVGMLGQLHKDDVGASRLSLGSAPASVLSLSECTSCSFETLSSYKVVYVKVS